MNLIPPTTPPATPPPQDIAENLIARANAMCARRFQEHREGFAAFWDDEKATPDEILAAMGNRARAYILGAGASYQHLLALSQIAGVDLPEALVPAFTEPRRKFLIDHATGMVTLAAPAEGYNAWGHPISPPDA